MLLIDQCNDFIVNVWNKHLQLQLQGKVISTTEPHDAIFDLIIHSCFLPADQTCFPNCNITHYDDFGDIKARNTTPSLSTIIEQHEIHSKHDHQGDARENTSLPFNVMSNKPP